MNEMINCFTIEVDDRIGVGANHWGRDSFYKREQRQDFIEEVKSRGLNFTSAMLKTDAVFEAERSACKWVNEEFGRVAKTLNGEEAEGQWTQEQCIEFPQPSVQINVIYQ